MPGISDFHPERIVRICLALPSLLARFAVVALAWCGANMAAEATPRDVFTGEIGGANVVLELNADDDAQSREGRYFYVRHGVDIPLRGNLEALAEGLPLKDLNLPSYSDVPVFADPATDRPRVIWQGRLKDGNYKGIWYDAATGRSLPFALRRVATYDPDALKPDAVEAVTRAIVQGANSGVSSSADITLKTDPYDFFRLNVPMQQEPEVVTGEGVAYHMLTDPRTHVRYPRLTRHPDVHKLLAINRLLEQRHWNLNLEALACASTAYTHLGPAAGTLGDFDNEVVTVDYLSTTLMSVIEAGSTYCGGAHPNNHYEPYTLDLIEGGYFDFSRILSGYGYGEYGTREYSTEFMAFVRGELRRQALSLVAADTECSDIWPEYLYLHFTAPGELAFDVSGIGHALGVCLGTHLTVPFVQLQPMLKPDAARYFPHLPRSTMPPH